jgi:hypothetical protein
MGRDVATVPPSLPLQKYPGSSPADVLRRLQRRAYVDVLRGNIKGSPNLLVREDGAFTACGAVCVCGRSVA